MNRALSLIRTRISTFGNFSKRSPRLWSKKFLNLRRHFCRKVVKCVHLSKTYFYEILTFHLTLVPETYGPWFNWLNLSGISRDKALTWLIWSSTWITYCIWLFTWSLNKEIWVKFHLATFFSWLSIHLGTNFLLSFIRLATLETITVLIALGHFFHSAKYSHGNSWYLAIYSLGHSQDKFGHETTGPLFQPSYSFGQSLVEGISRSEKKCQNFQFEE